MVQENRLPVACFAPDLTDEKIAEYRQIADSLPDSRGAIRDAIRECLVVVSTWWELPESTGSARDRLLEIRHRGETKLFKVTTLSDDLKRQLYDIIPWSYEISAMQALFDDIPAEERELRNCAFHLLWFVIELNQDREPITQTALMK